MTEKSQEAATRVLRKLVERLERWHPDWCGKSMPPHPVGKDWCYCPDCGEPSHVHLIAEAKAALATSPASTADQVSTE